MCGHVKNEGLRKSGRLLVIFFEKHNRFFFKFILQTKDLLKEEEELQKNR